MFKSPHSTFFIEHIIHFCKWSLISILGMKFYNSMMCISYYILEYTNWLSVCYKNILNSHLRMFLLIFREMKSCRVRNISVIEKLLCCLPYVPWLQIERTLGRHPIGNQTHKPFYVWNNMPVNWASWSGHDIKIST